MGMANACGECFDYYCKIRNMRKTFIFILTVLAGVLSQSVSAQDIIVTQSGDAKKVYGVEVGETAVFYKAEDKADAPIMRMDKSDVLVIKYKDGTSRVFTGGDDNAAGDKQQPAATETAAATAGPTMLKPSDLSAEAAEANAAVLAQMNVPAIYQPEEPGEKARYALMGFGVKGTSVVDDGNVRISVACGEVYSDKKNEKLKFHPVDIDGLMFVYYSSCGMLFQVQNKTNKPIYIDLGNSFYISLGQSTCYYVPSSTTNSSSSRGGAGVNLGSVAGALGVGGVVGQLAGGVNVGGGKSSGASSTTYAQRVISIPPMATYNLEPVKCFSIGSKIAKGLSYNGIPEMNVSKESAVGSLKAGMHYVYTEENSPIELSNIITYSFSEDCSNAKMLPMHLYLKDVIGVQTGGWGTNYRFKGDLSFQKKLLFVFSKVNDDEGENFQLGTLVSGGTNAE